MSDPLSIITISAAIGGAAGKFAEKAWDSGERWLNTYFENHGVKAQKKAKLNSLEFLKQLSKRIEKLEKDQRVTKSKISKAMEHPEFTALLQKGIINSAQIDNEEKRGLLARLIAERLKYPAESTYSLASKMACEAIANSTPQQLLILGLLSFIQELRFNKSYSAAKYQQILERLLSPFSQVGEKYNEKDLLHLEALSCITYQRGSERSLEVLLRMKNGKIDHNADLEARFDEDNFANSALGSWLNIVWLEALAGVYLTSVGLIIGKFVFDETAGLKTADADWP